MKIIVHPSADAANAAAAEILASWLTQPETKNIMVAAGNTPLGLYRRVAALQLPLRHLRVHALDEYVGVPLDEPRNCANLLRQSVARAWGIPLEQFFAISSVEADALESVRDHESRIEQAGGLDAIVLGLGQNGHLGFNEPGSAENSTARVLDLELISVEANRQWFAGRHAPSRGATVGLKTILAARQVILLAYGPHKAAAAKAMLEGPRTEACPASLLQEHPNTTVILDENAALPLTCRK